MNYRWDSGALDDLEEASTFYFQQDPDLEVRFASCIDNALERVIERPEAWPILEEDVRRYVVEVFPYSLLYSIERDHVLILAVAHQSRDPEYWRDRLNDVP